MKYRHAQIIECTPHHIRNMIDGCLAVCVHQTRSSESCLGPAPVAGKLTSLNHQCGVYRTTDLDIFSSRSRSMLSMWYIPYNWSGHVLQGGKLAPLDHHCDVYIPYIWSGHVFNRGSIYLCIYTAVQMTWISLQTWSMYIYRTVDWTVFNWGFIYIPMFTYPTIDVDMFSIGDQYLYVYHTNDLDMFQALIYV